MRVAMYYNNHDVRVQDLDKPKIGLDEVLFKVKACGICGSDVMEWYRIKKAPLVLGHEATGEIVEIGKNVRQYKVGQRVFVSHHVPCDICKYCLAGSHTACQTLHTTNFFPGGFSEYVCVPKINVDNGVLLLPDNVSFEEGTFIEPLACVIRGQRVVQIKDYQTVLILGSGISGLLHLVLAKSQGVKRIIMTDISEYRLKKASELGASLAISAKDDVIGHLRELNEARLADLVIVCTSAISAFNQALLAVDNAGTILCFAPTDPGVNLSVPINDFWRRNIKIIHSYGASPSDLSLAVELLAKKKLPVLKLVTHELGLEDAALGFRLVAEGKDCLKVIIKP
ncbi:MAG: alcohol dehydrogenase catalytic domain-containing protein [Candidatus Omnitrophota bacterium]